MLQFLNTKLGQFMTGTGWLALLYFIYTGKISTAMISAVIAALTAGGGVHFIYTRNNGKSNGNGNGASSPTGGSTDVSTH